METKNERTLSLFVLLSWTTTFPEWRVSACDVWSMAMTLNSLSPFLSFQIRLRTSQRKRPSAASLFNYHHSLSSQVLKYCKTSLPSDYWRQTRQTDGREKKRKMGRLRRRKRESDGRCMDRAACDAQQNGKPRERSHTSTQVHIQIEILFHSNHFAIRWFSLPLSFESVRVCSSLPPLFLLSAPIVLIKSVRLGVEGWWMECKRQRERQKDGERVSDSHPP